MRFRVSQELRQPVGTEFVMELGERSLFLDDDADLTDVVGSARLLRTDRGLLVTVRATANIRVTCSRCLTPARPAIELAFEEEFIPLVDPVTGARIKPAEAEGFVIDEELMLNLGESLRQYAVMSAPGKPLCRPDCAGLCPTCGANLNDGPCSCPTEVDERWQALAGLKAKDRRGS